MVIMIIVIISVIIISIIINIVVIISVIIIIIIIISSSSSLYSPHQRGLDGVDAAEVEGRQQRHLRRAAFALCVYIYIYI